MSPPLNLLTGKDSSYSSRLTVGKGWNIFELFEVLTDQLKDSSPAEKII